MCSISVVTCPDKKCKHRFATTIPKGKKTKCSKCYGRFVVE